jgi:hypothetical protein
MDRAERIADLAMKGLDEKGVLWVYRRDVEKIDELFEIMSTSKAIMAVPTMPEAISMARLLIKTRMLHQGERK